MEDQIARVTAGLQWTTRKVFAAEKQLELALGNALPIGQMGVLFQLGSRPAKHRALFYAEYSNPVRLTTAGVEDTSNWRGALPICDSVETTTYRMKI